MNDNAIFTALRTILLEGLPANGFASVCVKQGDQPTNQGAEPGGMTGNEFVPVQQPNGQFGAAKASQFAPTVGTAAAKAASNNSYSTLASVAPTPTVGHLAVFADTSGTLTDGGAVPSTPTLHTQVIASGTSWTSPANITTATVFEFTVVGGGAGGGGAPGGYGCGAGGSGGAAIYTTSGLSPSTGYSCAIGAGGAGGGSGAAGGAGGTTYISLPGMTVYGYGGNPGTYTGSGGGAGGSGGAASGGALNLQGGAGSPQVANLGDAPDGGNSIFGGAGQGNPSGAGGAGGAPGAGGGTGYTSTGGAGAAGVIIVRWVG